MNLSEEFDRFSTVVERDPSEAAFTEAVDYLLEFYKHHSPAVKRVYSPALNHVCSPACGESCSPQQSYTPKWHSASSTSCTAPSRPRHFPGRGSADSSDKGLYMCPRIGGCIPSWLTPDHPWWSPVCRGTSVQSSVGQGSGDVFPQSARLWVLKYEGTVDERAAKSESDTKLFNVFEPETKFPMFGPIQWWEPQQYNLVQNTPSQLDGDCNAF